MVLRLHGITSTKVLQALERDDMKELNINLGQQAVLWNLVKDLQSLEMESRFQGSCKDKQYDDQGQGKYGWNYDRTKQENKRFDQRHRKKGGDYDRTEQANKRFDQMHRKKGGGDERSEQGDKQNNRK